MIIAYSLSKHSYLLVDEACVSAFAENTLLHTHTHIHTHTHTHTRTQRKSRTWSVEEQLLLLRFFESKVSFVIALLEDAPALHGV